jgi:hypothetical protein
MVLLLHIDVNLLWSVLREVVEHLEIGTHRLVTLLQIHKLSMLELHNACWDVLRTKVFTELGPLHLLSGASGSEVDPPCSSIA